MRYVGAFARLGYGIENQRQDWSAEKADGVCITLWSKEIDWPTLVMDSREHANDIAHWGEKAGNAKRKRHAIRALAEFDGWIDAILVNGVPGEGYGSATPWEPSDRKGLKWRVVDVDETSGHLRLEAQPPGS